MAKTDLNNNLKCFLMLIHMQKYFVLKERLDQISTQLEPDEVEEDYLR